MAMVGLLVSVVKEMVVVEDKLGATMALAAMVLAAAVALALVHPPAVGMDGRVQMLMLMATVVAKVPVKMVVVVAATVVDQGTMIRTPRSYNVERSMEPNLYMMSLAVVM